MKKLMSKYGLFIVIVVLLAIFLVVALFTKDTGSDKAFVSMSVDKWQEKVKENKVYVTTFAQTGCSWCQQFKPVEEKVAKDNNVQVIWFDVNTLSSEKEYNKLTGTFKELDNFGTPYTIFTKNNKIIGEISGFVEKAELVKKFKEYGVIK